MTAVEDALGDERLLGGDLSTPDDETLAVARAAAAAAAWRFEAERPAGR